jgi:hypothetical protein
MRIESCFLYFLARASELAEYDLCSLKRFIFLSHKPGNVHMNNESFWCRAYSRVLKKHSQ